MLLVVIAISIFALARSHENYESYMRGKDIKSDEIDHHMKGIDMAAHRQMFVNIKASFMDSKNAEKANKASNEVTIQTHDDDGSNTVEQFLGVGHFFIGVYKDAGCSNLVAANVLLLNTCYKSRSEEIATGNYTMVKTLPHST